MPLTYEVVAVDEGGFVDVHRLELSVQKGTYELHVALPHVHGSAVAAVEPSVVEHVPLTLDDVPLAEVFASGEGHPDASGPRAASGPPDEEKVRYIRYIRYLYLTATSSAQQARHASRASQREANARPRRCNGRRRATQSSEHFPSRQLPAHAANARYGAAHQRS